MTSDAIAPCPIMVGMKDVYLGNIATSNPAELTKKYPTPPCTECSMFDLCGGRCRSPIGFRYGQNNGERESVRW